MEIRRLKILFGKSGSGSISPRISLPIGWIRDMGVTQEDRDVTISYNEETKEIIITKKN